MKQFATMLLCVTTSIAYLSSCGDDDENTNGSNSSNDCDSISQLMWDEFSETERDDFDEEYGDGSDEDAWIDIAVEFCEDSGGDYPAYTQDEIDCIAELDDLNMNSYSECYGHFE